MGAMGLAVTTVQQNPFTVGSFLMREQGPQPFVSEWRRDFEAYLAAERAERAAARARGEAAAAGRGGRKRGRDGASGMVHAGRRADGSASERRRRSNWRPATYCDQAGCGTRLIWRKGVPEHATCFRCREAQGLREPCVTAGCVGRVNKQRTTHGFCRKCFSKRRWEMKLGPRPVCNYADATHRCTEPLNRKNSAGLCGWHRPERRDRARYRDSEPRMVRST